MRRTVGVNSKSGTPTIATQKVLAPILSYVEGFYFWQRLVNALLYGPSNLSESKPPGSVPLENGETPTHVRLLHIEN